MQKTSLRQFFNLEGPCFLFYRASTLSTKKAGTEAFFLREQYPERMGLVDTFSEKHLEDLVEVAVDPGNDIPLGCRIRYRGPKTEGEPARMSKETVIKANDVAAYLWKNIQSINPSIYEQMRKEVDVYGVNAVAFGFDEQFNPIACYVAF